MTAMSETYTFSTSDGVESDTVIRSSFSKEVGITTNQLDVLAEETVSLRFSLLLERWHKERGPTSSVSNIIRCDSYQQIIKMGKRALPLILAQLKQEGNNPDHWFIALEAITGEEPIPENAYGNMLKMSEAWLCWAEKNDVR